MENGSAVKKPLAPVPQARVRIDDAFWAPRLQTNRMVTIPLIYQRCVETGRLAVLRSPGESQSGEMARLSDVWESEISKWLEAASYTLASHPDAALSRQVDEVIERVRSAQQPDGYVNLSGAALKPDQHWTDLENRHELYCASHLLEAAVTHFQSTGKRTLLDVACRFADHIGSVFGPARKRGYPKRPGIELALTRLHGVTGEARYLALAQHFVEERGRTEKRSPSSETPEAGETAGHECGLLNSPVRQQKQAAGHAARALSFYAALTDVGRETSDDTLIAAALRLWDSVYTKQTYVTGGIGSSRSTQGFTCDYDLPNESAWAETCASIASVFWNHRLLHWNCEARFGDELERALFNGVLAAVSLDGQRFFHTNPLAMRPERVLPEDPVVKAQRVNWFTCACCPPNLARLLASLGQYIYSESDAEIAVHLFVQSRAQLNVKGQVMVLRQETEYPWEGNVRLTIESMAAPAEFSVRIRLPGWCREPQVDVNGVAATGIVRDGYAVLRREWRKGDFVQLTLPMPVERVRSHPMVFENRGCVALRRGPLVYCLESVDNGPLDQLALPPNNFIEARFEPGLFGGSKIIYAHAVAITEDTWNGPLYRQEQEHWREAPLRAIPYYCWANRAPGEMRVWIREAEVSP
jgi:DUF1680 family protein